MKARGFTLLELLVAITVLSIVSIISWRGLDSLVATRERLEPEVDEVRAMLIAFGQMERDLTQAVNPAFLGLASSPVNVRPADGAWMLELARVAPAAPDRPTEVQTVYYRIVDNTLVRQSTPALPGFGQARTDQLENARLLQGVRSMDFRLWQQGVGWTPPGDRIDTGSAPGGAPAAPGARSITVPGLEITVTRMDGRTYRRIFLVNG